MGVMRRGSDPGVLERFHVASRSMARVRERAIRAIKVAPMGPP